MDYMQPHDLTCIRYAQDVVALYTGLGFLHGPDQPLDHHLQRYSCRRKHAVILNALWVQLYKEYAPYQFLAYWHELWHSYEQLQGPFSELTPDKYKSFTGEAF